MRLVVSILLFLSLCSISFSECNTRTEYGTSFLQEIDPDGFLIELKEYKGKVLTKEILEEILKRNQAYREEKEFEKKISKIKKDRKEIISQLTIAFPEISDLKDSNLPINQILEEAFARSDQDYQRALEFREFLKNHLNEIIYPEELEEEYISLKLPEDAAYVPENKESILASNVKKDVKPFISEFIHTDGFNSIKKSLKAEAKDNLEDYVNEVQENLNNEFKKIESSSIEDAKRALKGAIQESITSTLNKEEQARISQEVNEAIDSMIEEELKKKDIQDLLKLETPENFREIQDIVAEKIQERIQDEISSRIQEEFQKTINGALSTMNPNDIPFGPGVLLFSGCTEPTPLPCDPVCTCKHGCGSIVLSWLCGGCHCMALNPVYLPTTVILPIVETDFLISEEALTSTTQVQGNYISYTVEPEEVLEKYYGLETRFCKGSPDGEDKTTYADLRWQNTPEKKYLLTLKEVEVPARRKGDKVTSVEERFLEDSWGFLIKALDDMGMLEADIHVGLSPFTNVCEDPEYGNIRLVHEAMDIWTDVGTFLNKFDKSIIQRFLAQRVTARFDYRSIHSVAGKPIFYVFEKYKCCVDIETFH